MINAPTRVRRLTSVELNVLSLSAEGYTTVETAAQLGRRPNTIEVHRKHIIQKLRAKNMCNAIALACHFHFLDN